MNLKRAIELCQEPLERNKSHIVKVDRYAVVHLLADHKDRTSEAVRLRVRVLDLEDIIEKLENELKKVKETAAA